MSTWTSSSQPFAARAAHPAEPDEASAVGGPSDHQRYRQQLLARRAQLLMDVSSLVRDVAIVPTGNPLADGAADCDLQDTSLGLVDGNEQTLWLIDRALAKLDGQGNLAFGICEYSGQPIARERLELMPWTPLSIEGATCLEQGLITIEDLHVL